VVWQAPKHTDASRRNGDNVHFNRPTCQKAAYVAWCGVRMFSVVHLVRYTF